MRSIINMVGAGSCEPSLPNNSPRPEANKIFISVAAFDVGVYRCFPFYFPCIYSFAWLQTISADSMGIYKNVNSEHLLAQLVGSVVKIP